MEITATKLAHIEQMLQTEEERYTAFRNSGYDRDAEIVRHRLHGMIAMLEEFGFTYCYDENLHVRLKAI